MTRNQFAAMTVSSTGNIKAAKKVSAAERYDYVARWQPHLLLEVQRGRLTIAAAERQARTSEGVGGARTIGGRPSRSRTRPASRR